MPDGNLTTLPFGEWRPDAALLDNQLIGTAENVYPEANAYIPVPSLSFQSTSTLGTGNDSLVKILLHMDGADAATTFPDSAMGATPPTARTWTAAGNAQVDTAQSKFGGASLLCDGTGDWITTPNSTDLDMRLQDFTVDFWFNVNAAGGADIYAFGQCDNTASASSTTIRGGRNSSNQMFFQAASGAAITTVTGTTQFTNAVNTGWHHYEVVLTGTTLKMFIDGVQEGGNVTFSGTLNNSTNAFRVGALGEFTTTPWNGWIDEFRLSIGTARNTTTFTPPTAFYDACRGMFMAKTTSGTNAFFAGTAIKLYKLSTIDGNWTDVSRSSGGNYNLGPGDFWSFAQFGANVYATHVNDALQSIDATSGTNFAATAGSPPQAGHVATVGDFLVLSGLSSNKKMIQWSAINDPTGWTVGTNLSDQQAMPDGGDVLGVAGDTIGIVVQERALRSMQFLPGDTDRIFAFSKVESERGATGKLAFVYTNGTLFFKGANGFFAWNGSIQPIGHDAVDIFHGKNFDNTLDNKMVVIADPGGPHIWFSFYSSSSSLTYNHSFIYDYVLNRWSYCTEDAQMWAPLANTAGVRKIGAVDTSGRPALLVGTNLAAIIDTAEAHLNPGVRTFVSGAYPVVDASTSLGSVALTVTPYTREVFTSQPAAGTAASIESNGWAALLSSARLHKFRVSIPAGLWTQAQGIIIDHQPDGEA